MPAPVPQHPGKAGLTLALLALAVMLGAVF